MYFDTHSHIQFNIFRQSIDEVVKRARKVGVQKIIACGTNLATSIEAVDLASEFHGIYAAIGIHPHHVYETLHTKLDLRTHIGQIELLLQNPLVVAIGEVGVDRYEYKKTKYSGYKVEESFINLQKNMFERQIGLAKKYKKSLIIHNRNAVIDMLEVLSSNWDPFFSGRSVFHCCEPDRKLLDFAIRNNVYIGIDGDVTFDENKQAFIKSVPLELLVLETDSPFLTPNPFRASGAVNEPANITVIAQFIAKIYDRPIENVLKITYENGLKLFNLNH